MPLEILADQRQVSEAANCCSMRTRQHLQRWMPHTWGMCLSSEHLRTSFHTDHIECKRIRTCLLCLRSGLWIIFMNRTIHEASEKAEYREHGENGDHDANRKPHAGEQSHERIEYGLCGSHHHDREARSTEGGNDITEPKSGTYAPNRKTDDQQFRYAELCIHQGHLKGCAEQSTNEKSLQEHHATSSLRRKTR